MRITFCVCTLALPLILSCGAPGAAAPTPVAPTYPKDREISAKHTAKRSEPLVVEWPSSARAQLEARLRMGVVAARFTDAELDVLTTCRAETQYDYMPVSPKREVVTIRSEDELGVNLPVFAANFKTTLRRAGQLNVDMTLVGRLESPKLALGTNDLKGNCKGATHFISAATLGAFEFSAGGSGSIEASADVAGAGASGKTSSTRHVLMLDGQRDKCVASKEAPAECRALIRLELLPLENAKVAPSVARLVDRSIEAFDKAGASKGNWTLGWMGLNDNEFKPHTKPSVSRWGIDVWSNGADFPPSASFNGASRTIPPQETDGQTIPPNSLMLHPGGYGDRSTLRWKAPKAGDYRVTAVFTGIFTPADRQQTMTDITVLEKGSQLWRGWINLNGSASGTSFVDTRTLAAGDTVDFVVGWGNNDYTNDNTFVDVTVAEQAR